jgi:hypothetical protein
MLIVLDGPVHVPKVGVTVIIDVNAAFVLFTAVNDGIVPEPDAGIPIPGCVFVQFITAVDGVLVTVCAGIVSPEQTLYVPPGLTVPVGLGLTNTTTVC